MGGRIVSQYRDLIIWQKGLELSISCYELTRSFPKEEIYGLVSQIRRSAVSIPTNVAEGFRRESPADFTRFLRIAQGSIKELKTLLEISARVGYCTTEVTKEAGKTCSEIGKMIRSLINKLKAN